VARSNEWEVFAHAAQQMADEEFRHRRDLASQFSIRQTPVVRQNGVALMRQQTRQEEADGPNIFIGRVITPGKGNASARAYIEGRGKWTSKVEVNEQGQERLKRNLETARNWASELQGLPIRESHARYLAGNSETRRRAKEMPLWARMHVRIKSFARAKRWNGVNSRAADVGILNPEKLPDIEAPAPTICLGNDIWVSEYEENAKAERMSENKGVPQTPMPAKYVGNATKREMKFKTPRYLLADLAKKTSHRNPESALKRYRGALLIKSAIRFFNFFFAIAKKRKHFRNLRARNKSYFRAIFAKWLFMFYARKFFV
jgi:hypothetical protein